MNDWFIVNARDAPWLDTTMGKFCSFELDGERFAQMGFNLNVLAPGEPMAIALRPRPSTKKVPLANETRACCLEM